MLMYLHTILNIALNFLVVRPDGRPGRKNNIIFMLRMCRDNALPLWIKNSHMTWAYSAQMSMVAPTDVTPVAA